MLGLDNGGNYFEICPYQGIISDPSNCTSYICYPSRCACGCASCSLSNQSNCTTCSSGYFHQINGTQCLDHCTSGYKNSTDNSCHPCDASCSVCTGPSNYECSACTSGYFLQPQPSTTCQSSCLVGYAADPTSNTCLSCGSGCLYCSAQNKICSLCQSGYLFQTDLIECIPFCYVGEYAAPNNTCLACSANCSQCANSSYCTACTSGYYLDNTTNTCFSVH